MNSSTELFLQDSLCYFDVADALKLEPSHAEAKEMLIAIQKRAELFRSQVFINYFDSLQ